jgi:hypothetical protein
MNGRRLNEANSPATIGRRLAPIPVLFRKSTEQNQKLDQRPDVEELGKEEEEKFYCASCGHLITTGRWLISVDGGHEHTFFNPAGIIFDIRCFKEAPGAVAAGNRPMSSLGSRATAGKWPYAAAAAPSWGGNSPATTRRRYFSG